MKKENEPFTCEKEPQKDVEWRSLKYREIMQRKESILTLRRMCEQKKKLNA